MIITKEVEVTIACSSIKHYRELGYDCKVGDVLVVSADKAHKNCNEIIEYVCDLCNTPHQAHLKNFRNHHSFDDEVYCVECANLLRMGMSKEHIRQYFNSVAKDGYRICKKCLRELPLDIKYFNHDKNCPDGLRFICRECSGKQFKVHDENWSKDWTEEEINLLKAHYAEYTGRELKEKFFPDRTIRAIECAGQKLKIAKNDNCKAKANKIRSGKCRETMTGRSLTEEAKQKLSLKAKERFLKFGSPTKGLK